MHSTAVCTLLLFFIMLHVGNGSEAALNDDTVEDQCTVNPPQKASWSCQKTREKELANQKLVFQLESKLLPLPAVNMSASEVYMHFVKDSFSKEMTKLYVGMVKKKNLGLRQHWLGSHPLDVKRYKTYYDIFNFFRDHQSQPLALEKFFRVASKFEPFVDIVKNWFKDDMFAEQRVAGNNPMSLRRVVTDKANVGIQWSELRKVLNPNFNWEAAVRKTTGLGSFAEALNQGAVYAVRYELFDDLKSMPDINETNPDRHMKPAKSTIGLFAVQQRRKGRRSMQRLKSVAIQMDYKQDSPVYTPADGDRWELAKLTLQETDGFYSQVVEHLVKVHLLAEPFCVCMYRHLSNMHPINQLLKYHCRGGMLVNAVGGPTLVTKGNYVHQMYAPGYLGAISLVVHKHQSLTWNDADFLQDLKKRGVDDGVALKYYPFRDDGRVIHSVISRMIKEYVNLYYENDCDISNDKELQAFANEISADGTGPDGGNGKIEDFPARMTSKEMLMDTLTRIVWLSSAQHSAVNYPTSDYSALATCVPTKLYDDDRYPPGVFSVLNLPNAYIAATQAVVAMNIGVLRYDELFDYGDKLPDKRAGEIVQKYYQFLRDTVRPLLEERNLERLKNRHLTYPYFLPRWIPNSIQT